MSFWKTYPFIRLSIPFLIGIILSNSIERSVSIQESLIVLGVFFIGFCWTHIKLKQYSTRWLNGVLINCLFFGFGVIYQNVNKNAYIPPRISISQSLGWVGEVEQIRSKDETLKSFEVRVQKIKLNAKWERCNFKLKVHSNNDSLQLFEGDMVAANSYLKTPSIPKNPFAFDYRSYLKKKGIHYISFIKELNVLETSFSIKKSAAKTRGAIYQAYKNFGISGDELAVLTALTLGDKSQLSNVVLEQYSHAGAMHILAVSGLHVGIVYLLVSFCLKLLKDNKIMRWIKASVLLLVIWSFAFISGLSPSVQRASCMFSFVIIGKALNRNSNVINIVGASALFLILINPNVVYQIGFQLSYAAVFGIIILYTPIYSLLHVKSWLINKIWSLTVVSFSAQLATLPLVIFYFHQFPNLFWLTNLIVIPMAFIVLSLAIVATLFYTLLGTHLVLGDVLYSILRGLNYCVEWITMIPFSVNEHIWINRPTFILLCLFVISFIVYVSLVKVKWLSMSMLFLLCFTVSLTWDTLRKNEKQEIIFYTTNTPLFSVINYNETQVYIDNSIQDIESDLEKARFHLNAIGKNKIKEIDIKKSSLIQVVDKLILLTNNIHEINEVGQHVDIIVMNSDSLKEEPEWNVKVQYIDYGSNSAFKLYNEGNPYRPKEQGFLKILL